jgi:hypothetical protein
MAPTQGDPPPIDPKNNEFSRGECPSVCIKDEDAFHDQSIGTENTHEDWVAEHAKHCSCPGAPETSFCLFPEDKYMSKSSDESEEI